MLGQGTFHLPAPSKRNHPQIHLYPLQRQELTGTLASGWKTPVKQTGFRKEVKGGSEPDGHAAVGGWGIGRNHVKHHVRPEVPERGPSPGGSRIKTHVLL